MTLDFNQHVIDQFRAGQGRVGPPFENARLLLLTTTGARTGDRRTTPLGYLLDEEPGRLYVIASAGGSPRHPAWFHNLRKNPRVTVETGAFTYEAQARVLEGPDRERIFARAVESDPGWRQYEDASGRTLPVVALESEGPPAPGPARPGDALKLIHDAMRRELAIVRQEVAASGGTLGAQLRVNCLAVCQGLSHHHRMEDAHLFPRVGEQYPELADVMARLRREHEEIARLLEKLQRLLGAGHADRATVSEEVDRLTAQVEAHLDHEEENLIPLLNAAAP
ncbi:nitroreductase/quinone reductase family protein [Nonomuraea sp. MCN248]|uniref:Nitroreductase/quinone reductase family protein n=1 Tax=Nonomuraea corallina TaxID=2989783 RepID=A0ABT4SJ18_9ACTN|nr:nitroreductase/quinone reductase family protein [Nonomuraea corallina]MDA0637217.1 nitroreductase/quinone reductase family protein [Nonomuraea corallina]